MMAAAGCCEIASAFAATSGPSTRKALLFEGVLWSGGRFNRQSLVSRFRDCSSRHRNRFQLSLIGPSTEVSPHFGATVDGLAQFLALAL
ncbi:hypothetical protein CCGE531_30005 (plasmid) [Rhizobium sp. CCGE531]|nr:hypothetical protein CCGE531_30005 [Rhizobium sp. CCGE531]